MPPKKAATGTNGEAAEGGKFVWEGANENKLLLIILGRHIQTSEYEEVSRAFPGATAGAIRNRIGVLRAKQKKVYEELGWELPNGGTSAKKAKSGPAKRASDEDGDSGEPETPSKKPRVSRKKEVKVERKDSGADDEDEEGMEQGGVKEEEEEEV